MKLTELISHSSEQVTRAALEEVQGKPADALARLAALARRVQTEFPTVELRRTKQLAAGP